MNEEYDVIIIGSGPAGSSAARSLTQLGLKALILEKEKLPRRLSENSNFFQNRGIRKKLPQAYS